MSNNGKCSLVKLFYAKVECVIENFVPTYLSKKKDLIHTTYIKTYPKILDLTDVVYVHI